MSVPNVDRCLRLLEALAAQPGDVSLGALAHAIGAPKSAAHRLLQALGERGYVQQDRGSQDYRLSLKVALLGFRYLEIRRLPDVAQAALDRLASDCGEYCRIAVVDGDALAWIAQAQGATQGLRYQPAMGREVVLHATATGKAWLATMPEARALELAGRTRFRTPAGFGPRVVRTQEELRRQLRETRRRGYALAIEEGEPGTVALATTFGTYEGDAAPVAGTVSIAGPRVRLGDARIAALAPRLRRAAAELTELWPLRQRQDLLRATATKSAKHSAAVSTAESVR